MEISQYMSIAQQGIQTAVWVSAPVLIFGLVAGLVVSIFQAATQINDASISFIPKIGSVVVALMIFGPFMLSKIAEFTEWSFGNIPNVLP
ncbi:MAG: flagellar biosynthesis protein FliQ [bacterium]|nr:flagellar biosynthesis protein FliQ [bacterium]